MKFTKLTVVVISCHRGRAGVQPPPQTPKPWDLTSCHLFKVNIFKHLRTFTLCLRKLFNTLITA